MPGPADPIYWSDDQIAEVGDDAYNAMVQRSAGTRWPGYLPDGWCWDGQPPSTNEPMCHACIAWRRFPPGQRHMGFSWWRICGPECACRHHERLPLP